MNKKRKGMEARRKVYPGRERIKLVLLVSSRVSMKTLQVAHVHSESIHSQLGFVRTQTQEVMSLMMVYSVLCAMPENQKISVGALSSGLIMTNVEHGSTHIALIILQSMFAQVVPNHFLNYILLILHYSYIQFLKIF